MEQKKRQEKIENERFMRGELPRSSNQDNINDGENGNEKEEDENEYYVGDSDDDDEVFCDINFSSIYLHQDLHSNLHLSFLFCFVAPFRVSNMR